MTTLPTSEVPIDAPRGRRETPLFWQALVGIPRVDDERWRRLDPLTRWLVAARAGVLVITLIPCLLAGLLAWRDRSLQPSLWLLVSIGLLLAHATNNLVNDLTDFLKGVDRGDYFRARYGTQPLEQGLLSVRGSIGYAAVTGGLALAVGVWLTVERGMPVLALTGAGIFFVLFYTWPLKYLGLGEPAVLVVWGPLMIGGAYYVITGRWSGAVLALSFVYALGATSVLFGKHIDKLDQDRGKGIRTLPVLLGERRARAVTIVLLALPYLLVVALVANRSIGWPVLAVLLAVPKLLQAVRVLRAPRPEAPPDGYPQEAWPLWFVSFAFVHNRAFGGAFVLGLLAEAILHRGLA